MPVQDPGDTGLPPAPEPGQKSASGRNPGGPPGGGPPPGPGPGGGVFGGIGGIEPQVFRLLSGFGEQLPIMVKRRGLGQMPGVSPGPPGRTDTVPALLSPGEMVMNNGVTQNPSIAQFLAALNIGGAQQMGAQPQTPVSQAPMGYEHGGMVPGRCPTCGGSCGGGDGYALGGFVPGYALGGFVNGFLGPGGYRGGFGSPQAATPSAPAGQTPGYGPDYSANPKISGGYTGKPGEAGGGWLGQTVYGPTGNVMNFNPLNPWGSFTNSRDPTAAGQADRTLGAYGQAGYFDPRGNQMLLNAMNEGAQGTADALVRRNVTAADLSGLDPAQRAVAKLQALRDTGRGVQDIMANTRAQALGNANDFAQNLYSQLLSGSLGNISADQQANLADHLANQANERAKKGQWGNIAGQVLGAGLGGYLGGLGGGGGAPASGGNPVVYGGGQGTGGGPHYFPAQQR